MKPKKKACSNTLYQIVESSGDLDKLHLSGPNILLFGIDSRELRAGAVLRSYPLIRRFVISFFFIKVCCTLK